MRKFGRKILSALLALALLASLLPIGAAPAQAADTTHDISQGTLTISENGNYTVTGTTTANNIVVNKNVTATVTLNNVSITGVEENSATGAPAQSPIDLADGATLILILQRAVRILSRVAQGQVSVEHQGFMCRIIPPLSFKAVVPCLCREDHIGMVTVPRGLEERLILQVRHQATTRAKIAARSSFCQVKV